MKESILIKIMKNTLTLTRHKPFQICQWLHQQDANIPSVALNTENHVSATSI